MLRKAKNDIYIEGIFAENNLDYRSYEKDGKAVEAIGGSITIKTHQMINGTDTELMVPVHMFSNKYKNDGNPNPAYQSIEKAMKEFVSIAASDEDTADAVRVTGSITMNDYYAPDGTLISYPRITSSFVSRVSKEKLNPRAEGEVEFCVANMTEEIKNDEPTGRMIIKGVVPKFNGSVDVVPFITGSAQVVDVANNYWTEGDTVKVSVKLNFSSTTEKVEEEADFGEPIVRMVTRSVNEILIIGGLRTPLDEMNAFDPADIREALAQRKATLDARKERDMSRAKVKKATPKDAKHIDLGF